MNRDVTIIINGWEVPQFLGFNQSMSINQFSDEFNLEIADPKSTLIFDKIDCENVVTTKIAGQTNKFRISNMQVQSFEPLILDIQGVSLESELALNEIEPKHYTGATDNFIIEEIFKGFKLDLDSPVILKEFDISSGMTRAEVASSVANENGFKIWASGGTIYKKKVKASGSPVKTYKQENILSAKLQKSTSEARNKLKAYSTSESNERLLKEVSFSPSSIFTGKSLSIDRTLYIRANSKDLTELDKTIQAKKEYMQPIEILTIEIIGRDDLALNEIAKIQIPSLKLNLNMVLNEKRFSVRSTGESKTELVFGGLGRYN